MSSSLFAIFTIQISKYIWCIVVSVIYYDMIYHNHKNTEKCAKRKVIDMQQRQLKYIKATT